MEYLVICLSSLAVSGLTLFSGFGLGTVLTPVMALFFPIETAVAATAVVHFAVKAIARSMLDVTVPVFPICRPGVWCSGGTCSEDEPIRLKKGDFG